MFKRVTLLVLITATVLLAYQLVWAVPVDCWHMHYACESVCGGWFFTSNCYPDPQCEQGDICDFVCLQQQNPWCHEEGQCCEY